VRVHACETIVGIAITGSGKSTKRKPSLDEMILCQISSKMISMKNNEENECGMTHGRSLKINFA